MKKLSLILLLILPVLSYAQTKYLLQQNLLMRSQLSFEENMVLVHVDPVTCLRGKNSKDRVRILKANIKTLEAKGELNHCPGTVILSKRRVLKNLKTQGIVLKDSLIKDGLDESKATKLVEVVPKLKEVDDVIQTSTDASSLHCVEKKKNDFPVGYVGVPFGIDENLDQTVSYRATSTSFKEGWECPAVGRGEHSLIFSSKNSPKGLSIYGDGGGYSLYSFPTVAGTFDFDVTGLVGGISANRYLKDKWKVTFLPTPKHTVFNSWERESGDAAGFLKGKAPFLELVWKGNYYPTPSGIRSASGVKQGKVYFEVRVKDIGDASKSFVAIDSSASEAGLIFAR